MFLGNILFLIGSILIANHEAIYDCCNLLLHYERVPLRRPSTCTEGSIETSSYIMVLRLE